MRRIRSDRRGRGFHGYVAWAFAAALVCALSSSLYTAAGASAQFQKTLPLNPADLSDARLTTALDLAADAGVTQIQTGATWWWLTRNGGPRSYDWSDLDRLVNAAENRGMRVVMQLVGTPDWVHPDLEETVPDLQDRIWYPPIRDSTERDHWADFVTDLVSRYGDRVSHYEIWNEPNMVEWWRTWPNPVAYARLMRRAHDAARAVDPDVTIVFAGLSQNAVGYLDAYYDEVERLFPEHGPASSYFFDVLGAHPYSYDRSPDVLDPQHVHSDGYGEVDENFLGFRRLRAVVEQREGSPKPVYIGEFGYPTWLVDDEQRAQYLTRAYRLAIDEGYVTGLSWYSYVPPSWEPGGGGWSIVDENFAPSATFEALRQFDAAAPDTNIDSGPSGLTNDNDPSFGFSSEPGATFECMLNPGGGWEPCDSPRPYTGMADGDHTFSVRAIDAAGNTDASPATRDLTVDTVAPETTVDSGPSGTTTDNDPSFAFSSEAGATFECSLDPGGSWEACASPKSYTDVAEGAHTFSVRATDSAGNVDPSPASRELSVEATTEPSPPISLPPAISLPPPSGWLDSTPSIEPPIADVTSPETGIDKGPSGRIHDRTPTFRFSSTEIDSELQCKVDGKGFRLCASPYTLRKLDFGRHVFAVRGIDAVGNVDPSPDVQRFRVAPRR